MYFYQPLLIFHQKKPRFDGLVVLLLTRISLALLMVFHGQTTTYGIND